LYQERVTKVFDRLQNIQTNVDSERQTKWKFALSIIENLERKVDEIYTSKVDKFEALNDKIKALFDHLHQQKTIQVRLDTEVQENIEQTKKNCVNLLDSFTKEREDSERRVYQKLNTQIDNLTIEIQRNYQERTASQNYLQSQLEDELPRFEQEIKQESQFRQDLEQRIYQQFSEQISELKEMFEVERKEREQREEELINILKVIYTKVSEAIARCKSDREKSEEMLVRLVEQVIEKIKKELSESDY
ncbi:hypothetical protein ABPG72_011357, partial [Tetrahymena utriculariae]